MIEYSDHGVVWYAMQTTYKRELKAKAYLDSKGIECFLPMANSVVVERGKRKIVSKPAVHNLIFIKADLTLLREVKDNLNFISNRLTEYNGNLVPIIVPTYQMDQFIAAITSAQEKMSYVDLSTVNLTKGTAVRITEGTFKGYEGILAKVKGKRDKRVVVSVENLVAYSLEVDVNFIERI